MSRPSASLLVFVIVMLAALAAAPAAQARGPKADVAPDPEVEVEVVGSERPLDHAAVAWVSGAVLAVAGLLIGVAYGPDVLRRRRQRRPRRGSGETAITARAVASLAEAERDVLSRRCTCKARVVGPLPESAWSSVALGDATVTVAKAVCPCGSSVRGYYLLPERSTH